jgi:hypothetical protein
MKPFAHITAKLLASIAFITLAACGGGGGGGAPDGGAQLPTVTVKTGTISGKAVDAKTGAGIAGAAVSYGALSTSTAADGSFLLTLSPTSASAVIKIEKANYAIGFATTPVEQDKTATTQATLSKITISAPLGIASGGTISDPNSAAQVTLPAAGLVDAAGNTATGNVTVNLSVIDPKSNAAAMPGDYTTNAGTTIESFGAIKVTLLSSAGAPLNLGAGKTATIRIPVSSSTAPDATIPLFYFNETTGKWVQDGTATLLGTAPNLYYEGTVTHFTYWNADKPAEIIYVNGCLKDASGAPIANAVVKSNGIDYSNTSSATTSSTGTFKVLMKKNGKASIFAGNGSNVVIAGPSAVDVTLPTCLVTAQASAPIIVTQPVNESVAFGAYATFNVASTPTGVQYAWYKNGVVIPNANSAILFVSNGVNGDTYFVKVSNAAGTTTSQTATLTVAAAPPTVITVSQQPTSANATVGGTANFAVQAYTTTAALTYQWRKNGVSISGATSPFYTTPVLTLAYSGAVYSVVMSGGGASVTSSNASLTVAAVPSQLSPVEQMRTVMVWAGLYASATQPLDSSTAYQNSTIQSPNNCTTGSQAIKIDNVTAVAGTAIPAGSHQIAVVSSNCTTSYSIENGTSSLAYTFNSQNGSVINGTGTVSFNGLRISELNYLDTTSTGSAVMVYKTSLANPSVNNSTFNQTVTMTPIVNSSVRNNLSTLTGIYVSGNSVDMTANTSSYINNVFGYTDVSSTTFNSFTYTVLGETYVLTGSLIDSYNNTGVTTNGSGTFTGQINVTRNGVLVGFLYTNATGDLMINTNGVLTKFFP